MNIQYHTILADWVNICSLNGLSDDLRWPWSLRGRGCCTWCRCGSSPRSPLPLFQSPTNSPRNRSCHLLSPDSNKEDKKIGIN